MSYLFFGFWFILPWVVVWFRNKRGKTWDEVNQRVLFQESLIALVVSTVGLVLVFLALCLQAPSKRT